MMHFASWPPEGDARPHMGYSYRDNLVSAWKIKKRIPTTLRAFKAFKEASSNLSEQSRLRISP